MEKSGSGAPNPQVIDSWQLKSRTRIFLESIFTVAFWTGFIYLLIPIITLLLWFFGIRIAYAELIGAEGLKELIKLIKNSGFIIFVVSLLLLSWGYYNYFLFRLRGERRNTRVLICFDEDFAARCQLDPEDLRAAKAQSRLVVHLDGERLEILSQLPPRQEDSQLLPGRGKPKEAAIRGDSGDFRPLKE